jgi:hypothetical protein
MILFVNQLKMLTGLLSTMGWGDLNNSKVRLVNFSRNKINFKL